MKQALVVNEEGAGALQAFDWIPTTSDPMTLCWNTWCALQVVLLVFRWISWCLDFVQACSYFGKLFGCVAALDDPVAPCQSPRCGWWLFADNTSKIHFRRDCQHIKKKLDTALESRFICTDCLKKCP